MAYTSNRDQWAQIKDQTAVVGIGWTPYTKNSGVSILSLATEACWNAIKDAGLKKDDVDGVAYFFTAGDSADCRQVASALGLPKLRWNLDYSGGGYSSNAMVAYAAMAVQLGLANYVVCFRALNGRSGYRIGGSGTAGRAPRIGGGGQFSAPYGFGTPPQSFAMMARRHMVKYGTTSEQFGAVAVAQRQWASLNSRAQMRTPITLEDHQNSRMVVEPFHLLDICLETDGGCAVIVTTAERAKDLPHPPVYLHAAAVGAMPGAGSGYMMPDLDKLYGGYLADDLWALADVTPKDIDACELYDCFTYITMVQLEDLGFVPKGEGGPFVASGAIAMGGSLPTNTHGGNLSEGYMQGLGHVVEAVQQLRGDAGERQVPNAEFIVTSGQGGLNQGGVLMWRR